MSGKILFLDNNHPVMIGLLRDAGFTCDEDYESPKAEIEKKLGDYNAVVIRSRFKLDKQFLDHGKALRCIARAGAGMENIDVTYAESKNIRCVHAPEGNRDAVAEHALGMLLALLNNLCRADREVRSGIWKREENRGHELSGKTVGIIGYGNTGSMFAQRLRGFDVNVLAYDKYKTGFSDGFVKEATPEQIFEEADILSLHIPLTDETHHLVNHDFIGRFRKNIRIINTARGQCLDTAGLVSQMKAGKVTGACLDVLEYEAVSFEQLDASALPEPFQYLVASDKVVLSPHIAGWTFESYEKIGRVLAGKIITVLASGR
ncbi:MAG: D-3-phosphoglycerate dehydrogenase [Bacteroidetes bacterium]|nr:MAG: D-3-phosphoglycerate dehydrogenase [Bacteroidota bacterium]